MPDFPCRRVLLEVIISAVDIASSPSPSSSVVSPTVGSSKAIPPRPLFLEKGETYVDSVECSWDIFDGVPAFGVTRLVFGLSFIDLRSLDTVTTLVILLVPVVTFEKWSRRNVYDLRTRLAMAFSSGSCCLASCSSLKKPPSTNLRSFIHNKLVENENLAL